MTCVVDIESKTLRFKRAHEEEEKTDETVKKLQSIIPDVIACLKQNYSSRLFYSLNGATHILASL